MIRTALAAAAMVGLATAAAPADATTRPINEGGDTAKCITYPEYTASIPSLGGPLRRFHRIYDVGGTRVSFSHYPALREPHTGLLRFPVCDVPEDEFLLLQYRTDTPRHLVVMFTIVPTQN